MEEVWKNILNTQYQCSNFGRFRRKTKDNRSAEFIYLLGYKNIRGYIQVCCPSRKLAHRIIAQTFIPNPLNKLEVNHINGIRHENRVDNLEWCTRSENTIHAVKTGLQKIVRRYGVDNKCSKPVIQLDKNNNFIKRWNYIKEAAKELNIVPSSISAVCLNKRKTAGGFKWKHVES